MANFICKGRGGDFVPMLDFMPDGAHIAIVEHHKLRGGYNDEGCNGMVGDFSPRILSIYNNDDVGHERAEADLDKMLAALAPKPAPTINPYAE